MMIQMIVFEYDAFQTYEVFFFFCSFLFGFVNVLLSLLLLLDQIHVGQI